MSNAGTATSISIGLALNQTSANVPATALVPVGTASEKPLMAVTTTSIARTSAIANPNSAAATNSPCTTMNHPAGMPVRR
jgi:hypothetical protein